MQRIVFVSVLCVIMHSSLSAFAGDFLKSKFLSERAVAQLQENTVFGDGENRDNLIYDFSVDQDISGISIEEKTTLRSRLSGEFVRYLNLFVKEDSRPSTDTLLLNLHFVRGSATLSRMDIAYCDCVLNGRLVRIAQTGQGMNGCLAFCFAFAPSELLKDADAEAAKAVANNVLNEYMSSDPKAIFSIGDLEHLNNDAFKIKPLYGLSPDYRSTAYGMVSRIGMCIVFPRKHPFYRSDDNTILVDPPLPAHEVLPEEWFQFFLDTPPPNSGAFD